MSEVVLMSKGSPIGTTDRKIYSIGNLEIFSGRTQEMVDRAVCGEACSDFVDRVREDRE